MDDPCSMLSALVTVILGSLGFLAFFFWLITFGHRE